MNNSIIPSTIGSTPINSTNGSQLVFGRDVSVTFEAIGLGQTGRPDVLQKLIINLSTINAGVTTKTCSITLDPAAIITLITSNPNIPSPVNMSLVEAAVCVADDSGNTTEQRMIIIGSATYLPHT